MYYARVICVASSVLVGLRFTSPTGKDRLAHQYCWVFVDDIILFLAQPSVRPHAQRFA